MGYPIIFKTKIVNLSDGRILHLAADAIMIRKDEEMTNGMAKFIRKKNLQRWLIILWMTVNQ